MAWNLFNEIVYRLQQWENERQSRKMMKKLDDQFLRMVSGGNDDFYRKLKKAVKEAKPSTDAHSGTHAGHAYVDMGLSVKWATCNIGASSPEDYGDYFAWGETGTKLSYMSYNCATWEKEIGDIAGTNRDVAHVKWGGSWRLPTRTEFEELLDEDNCTWTWTTLDGHNGYKVKSKKTGNWIFLPAAGWRGGTSLGGAGEYGYYWSSTPYESLDQGAAYLYFDSSCRFTRWSWYSRYRGQPVRPVGEF